MDTKALQRQWQGQAEEVLATIAQWRASHPSATMAQIEAAVDEQMNQLRAQVIEASAQASAAAQMGAEGGRVCEQCGKRLQARGRRWRTLRTQGDQRVELERTYLVCPQCGVGFFPPG